MLSFCYHEFQNTNYGRGNKCIHCGYEEQNKTDENVLLLMRSGHKIDAIKEYRYIHGVGLKEAKDAVESIVL